MPSTRYRVIYFVGSGVDITTQVSSGTLTFGADGLKITGEEEIVVPFVSFVDVEMFRLHNTGRMMKLTCVDRTIFMSVVWFSIGGKFAIINYFRTGALFEKLKMLIEPANEV